MGAPVNQIALNLDTNATWDIFAARVPPSVRFLRNFRNIYQNIPKNSDLRAQSLDFAVPAVYNERISFGFYAQ